jgi:hypothetical protein
MSESVEVRSESFLCSVALAGGRRAANVRGAGRVLRWRPHSWQRLLREAVYSWEGARRAVATRWLRNTLRGALRRLRLGAPGGCCSSRTRAKLTELTAFALRGGGGAPPPASLSFSVREMSARLDALEASIKGVVSLSHDETS